MQKQRRNNFPNGFRDMQGAEIIIQLINNDNTNFSNVTIYNALQQRFNAAGNYGLPQGVPPLGKGVTANCLSGNGVTYADLLGTAEAKPMRIESLWLLSNTGTGSPMPQVLEPITIISKDDKGAMLTEIIVPEFDVFSTSKSVLGLGKTFLLDGYTSISFQTLYAGATLEIYLNIDKRFNATRRL